MKYKNWTLGQVEAVFNKLGGEKGVRDFLAGEMILRPISHWLHWKTMLIGGRSQSSFIEMLEKNGVKFGSSLQELLKSYKLPIAGRTSVNLVKVSGLDLGFTENVYPEEMYNRAKKIGLELCPPEVGFHLPLQCSKKQIGNNKNIVSSVMAIDDSDGISHLIVVWHSGSDFWIEAIPCPLFGVSARISWIFVLPSK